MTKSGVLACHAIVVPGAEQVAAAELAALGLDLRETEPGGVGFVADQAGLYLANLQLRSVSRIVVRLATFRATSFHQLERYAKRLPWRHYLDAEVTPSFRVTSRKSRLYHGGAIAQRLGEASGGAQGGGAEQLFVVRVVRDHFTISIDSSGELLHRRGYRLATAKAPLRETLAAAMLLACGWDGRTPLLDPMCGSGTIPIEGALLARRIAPGLRRRFAFEQWPDFDAELWRDLLTVARERVLPAVGVPIMGSDRDAGAVAAARANAARAGVHGDIHFDCHSISRIEPPVHPGLILSNPPYGTRIGDRRRLRDLYAGLGQTLRRRCGGWDVALLSAHAGLVRAVGLPLIPSLLVPNGGIRVQLARGTVPSEPSATFPA